MFRSPLIRSLPGRKTYADTVAREPNRTEETTPRHEAAAAIDGTGAARAPHLGPMQPETPTNMPQSDHDHTHTPTKRVIQPGKCSVHLPLGPPQRSSSDGTRKGELSSEGVGGRKGELSSVGCANPAAG